jgi:uncharacterized protein YdhG (YjbR/CyaY superfamily)
VTRAIPANVRKFYQTARSPHKETMIEMRKRILELVPQAEEVVSYGMPAFKVNGNIVAGLLENNKHVGYYPFSGSILHLFEKELAKYSHTKSAIHVPLDKPLSKSLISKLIKARISQCPVKQGKVDLEKYKNLDSHWRELGIAAPARRGLIDNKIYKLTDLKKWSEIDFMKIHAIGISAAKIIKAEMKRKKVKFK